MSTTISNTDTHTMTVFQGKTFIEVFNVTALTDTSLPYDEITNPYIPMNISAYDVRMMVRTTPNNPVIKIQALSTGTSPRFVKNTSSVTLTLLPTDTSVLTFSDDEVDWYYDIELAHQSEPIVLLLSYGTFNLKREVTR